MVFLPEHSQKRKKDMSQNESKLLTKKSKISWNAKLEKSWRKSTDPTAVTSSTITNMKSTKAISKSWPQPNNSNLLSQSWSILANCATPRKSSPSCTWQGRKLLKKLRISSQIRCYTSCRNRRSRSSLSSCIKAGRWDLKIKCTHWVKFSRSSTSCLKNLLASFRKIHNSLTTWHTSLVEKNNEKFLWKNWANSM